jgi:ChpA-C
VKMRTRVAGVCVATAAAVAMMGAPAFADVIGSGNGGAVSILGGNEVNVPVQVPVNVCGVAVGIFGFAGAGCQGGAAAGILGSFNG